METSIADYTEIIAAVLGGIISWAGIAMKNMLGKRKNEAELEEIDARTDHLESTTLQNFVQLLKDLQEMNHRQLLDIADASKENIRQADEFAKQARAMAKLKSQYQETIRVNEILIQKSELLSATIGNLEQIVIEEQINKQKLRRVIRKLVGQLEEAGKTPDISVEEQRLL